LSRRHPKLRKEATKMRIFRHGCVPAILLLVGLVGCTQQQQSPEELKEKTAQATAEAKSDAKAVAEGIREGLSRNDNKLLDLNSASKSELMTLPGVTAAQAERVIAGRPYSDPGELVTRHIMPGAEYDKISGKVTAKK
jgi:competence protein ComEA